MSNTEYLITTNLSLKVLFILLQAIIKTFQPVNNLVQWPLTDQLHNEGHGGLWGIKREKKNSESDETEQKNKIK